MFYKSIYHLTAVQLPPYFLRTQQSTRQYHPLHFIVPSTNCDYYKYSFFPRAIRDWNNLPNDLIESSYQCDIIQIQAASNYLTQNLFIAYITVDYLIVMYSFGLVPWTHQTCSVCPVKKKKTLTILVRGFPWTAAYLWWRFL